MTQRNQQRMGKYGAQNTSNSICLDQITGAQWSGGHLQRFHSQVSYESLCKLLKVMQSSGHRLPSSTKWKLVHMYSTVPFSVNILRYQMLVKKAILKGVQQ